MKKSSFIAQLATGLLLAVATLSLTACADIIYHNPEYQYSARTIGPSGLIQRVMATYTSNGSSGGAEILDALRDTRSNVQDTIPAFFIKGYSSAQPTTILNFPEQQMGYILSLTDGVLGKVSYATEASTGTAATFGSYAPSAAAAVDGSRFAGVINGQGILEIVESGGTYALNLPNVQKVFINQGNSVILATVRNSNAVYRVIKLPQTTDPIRPPNYVDCEPLQLPVYCVVPVLGNASTATVNATFSNPSNVYFSLDGTSAFILNCGPECGSTVSGTTPTAGVTVLNQGNLQVDNRCIPGVAASAQSLCNYYSGSAAVPSPVATLPVANPIPVPGGVTVAVGNGNTLYMAGQQYQASTGLFSGTLSLLNLTNYTVSAPVSISDGSHTRILLADDSTLWIGGSQCANGTRYATAQQELATNGYTDQAGNYNCLTRVVYNPTTGAVAASGVSIIPTVTQSTNPSVPSVGVSYQNTNLDPYYYGNLTGLCWVQGFHKMYTAYGGQIHIFETNSFDAGGKIIEVDNQYVTVQGTVLDVAYIDALTNNAN